MAVHTRTPRVWGADEVALVQRVAAAAGNPSSELASPRTCERVSICFGRSRIPSRISRGWRSGRLDRLVKEQWDEYTGTTPADMEGWGWERVPSSNASGGQRTLAALNLDRHTVRDGVPTARRGRNISKISDTGQPSTRLARASGPLVRDQHGRRKRATSGRGERGVARARAARQARSGAAKATPLLLVHASTHADRGSSRAETGG